MLFADENFLVFIASFIGGWPCIQATIFDLYPIFFLALKVAWCWLQKCIYLYSFLSKNLWARYLVGQLYAHAFISGPLLFIDMIFKLSRISDPFHQSISVSDMGIVLWELSKNL